MFIEKLLEVKRRLKRREEKERETSRMEKRREKETRGTNDDEQRKRMNKSEFPLLLF